MATSRVLEGKVLEKHHPDENVNRTAYPDVLAISRPGDEHAAAILRFLQVRGYAVARFSLNDLRSSRFEWSVRDGLRLETSSSSLRVGANTTIWWRRTGWVETDDLSDEEAELTRAEGADIFIGALLTSQATWVDRPDVLFLAENKLYQLAVAQRLGLQIPATLVTNDRCSAEALAFFGPLLAKPVSSGPGLAPFADTLEPDDLTLVREAPTLLQVAISATADFRVVTVAESAYVWCRKRELGGPMDWRQVDSGGRGFTRQARGELEEAAIDVARALKLTMSVQDWLETEDGFIFLEANPQGQWLFLPGAREEVVPAVAKHLVHERQPRDGNWPSPVKQFLWNLLPASKVPSGSGVKPPVFDVPSWVSVTPTVEEEVVHQARRAHDQADLRARSAEEKGSRLVKTSLVLVATTLALLGYQIENEVLRNGFDIGVVSFLLLLAALFFLGWSALNAFAVDDVGLYFQVGAESPTKSAEPKREVLRIEEVARETANWTAQRKLDTLLHARAHFSRGVATLIVAALLWLMALIS